MVYVFFPNFDVTCINSELCFHRICVDKWVNKTTCDHEWYLMFGQLFEPPLTHWGRVTHIYSSVDSTIIGSNNGLSPIWHQAIIWTSDDLLSIRQ